MNTINDTLKPMIQNPVAPDVLLETSQGFWVILERKPNNSLDFFFVNPDSSYFDSLEEANKRIVKLKAAGYNVVLAVVAVKTSFKLLE